MNLRGKYYIPGLTGDPVEIKVRSNRIDVAHLKDLLRITIFSDADHCTNLDATPRVENTEGENGPGRLISVSGSNVAVASSSADATYQFVRVPSNCKIKALFFESAAQTAGKLDLGLYYATRERMTDVGRLAARC